MNNYKRLNELITKLGQINPTITGFDDSWLQSAVWNPVIKRIVQRLNNKTLNDRSYFCRSKLTSERCRSRQGFFIAGVTCSDSPPPPIISLHRSIFTIKKLPSRTPITFFPVTITPHPSRVRHTNIYPLPLTL